MNQALIDKLNQQKTLSHTEWCTLISTFTDEDFEYAKKLAAEITEAHFGNTVYFRGIIEFSNICKNDCYYCGIRKSNENAVRYRLTEEEILLCCEEGYRLGYRTFVLQSGEESFRTSDTFYAMIRKIKEKYSDCAVTLSVGECTKEEYQKMYDAGADRYLLRHETANTAHYQKIHPADMSLENRIQCLWNLKEIGFQTGCGMMVGTPGQTPDTLAEDMEFMHDFQPHMVGIGPFLPHKDTPFKDETPGNQRLTLFLLALTRIMLPEVLLPSTTALGTAEKDGRIQGVLCGCNVVMPNLSPQNVRKNYLLYNNKSGIELSAEEGLNLLRKQMESIGRNVVTGRGDHAAIQK